jgi:hypothetical protein
VKLSAPYWVGHRTLLFSPEASCTHQGPPGGWRNCFMKRRNQLVNCLGLSFGGPSSLKELYPLLPKLGQAITSVSPQVCNKALRSPDDHTNKTLSRTVPCPRHQSPSRCQVSPLSQPGALNQLCCLLAPSKESALSCLSALTPHRLPASSIMMTPGTALKKNKQYLQFPYA